MDMTTIRRIIPTADVARLDEVDARIAALEREAEQARAQVEQMEAQAERGYLAGHADQAALDQAAAERGKIPIINRAIEVLRAGIAEIVYHGYMRAAEPLNQQAADLARQADEHEARTQALIAELIEHEQQDYQIIARGWKSDRTTPSRTQQLRLDAEQAQREYDRLQDRCPVERRLGPGGASYTFKQ